MWNEASRAFIEWLSCPQQNPCWEDGMKRRENEARWLHCVVCNEAGKWNGTHGTIHYVITVRMLAWNKVILYCQVLSGSKLHWVGSLGVALKGAKIEKMGGGMAVAWRWCTGASRAQHRQGLFPSGAAVHKDYKLQRAGSPLFKQRACYLEQWFCVLLEELNAPGPRAWTWNTDLKMAMSTKQGQAVLG